jgi:hypothetical protein
VFHVAHVSYYFIFYIFPRRLASHLASLYRVLISVSSAYAQRLLGKDNVGRARRAQIALRPPAPRPPFRVDATTLPLSAEETLANDAKHLPPHQVGSITLASANHYLPGLALPCLALLALPCLALPCLALLAFATTHHSAFLRSSPYHQSLLAFATKHLLVMYAFLTFP